MRHKADKSARILTAAGMVQVVPRGLALIWLLYSDFGLLGLSFLSILFGLEFIATVPATARIAAQAFGHTLWWAVVREHCWTYISPIR